MSNGVYGAGCAGVIKIGDRFFHSVGRGGRILTAWSIAGARLYVCQRDIDEVFAMVKSKHPKAVLGEVRLIAEQVAL